MWFSKKKQIDRNLKSVDNAIIEIRGSYNINVPTSKQCEYPGCYIKMGLEEHHINPQANIKAATPFLKKLRAKSRKTVTLCRKHHLLVHGKTKGDSK